MDEATLRLALGLILLSVALFTLGIGMILSDSAARAQAFGFDAQHSRRENQPKAVSQPKPEETTDARS